MFAVRARQALAASLAMLMLACAWNPAPVGWLPHAKDAGRQANGGWISLDFDKRDRFPTVQGELIAVTEDCVYALTDSGLRDVALASVKTATLGAYAPDAGLLATWSTLGTVATLSHGLFLFFTAPVWIIAGIATAAAEQRGARLRHPPTPFADFRPYARFPQGLPPGFDASALGPLRAAPSAARQSSEAAPRPGSVGTWPRCGPGR